MTGSDGTATLGQQRRGQRPAQPGATRFWCSCDPNREHPFLQAAELVQHVMEARAREAGDKVGAIPNAGRHQ